MDDDMSMYEVGQRVLVVSPLTGSGPFTATVTEVGTELVSVSTQGRIESYRRDTGVLALPYGTDVLMTLEEYAAIREDTRIFDMLDDLRASLRDMTIRLAALDG